MASSLRSANIAELPAIMQALLRLLARSTAPQMRFTDEDAASRSIAQAIAGNRCRFVGDFFIMFDIGHEWYMDSKHPPYLIEQIVIRVYRTGDGTVDDAVDALHTLATEHGCCAVASGDTQHGAMVPHYLKAGFVRLGDQFLLTI